MMANLKDKVAVVTGAASGLGRALATEFYKRGCHLALIDIDSAGLEELNKDLQGNPAKITIHQADVSKEQEIYGSQQQIIDQHQRVDILVNNAGISISQPFDQVSLADFKRLIDVNFWGAVYSSKYFLGDLKKQPDSRLVNIISDFALMGFPGKTTYASSKSAVMGFTNSLKTELADTTVKVCLVIPPPLDTGLVINSKHIDETKKQNEANFLRKYSMASDKAAKRIVSKIQAGQYRIVVGSMMFWIDLASRLFPTTLHELIGKNKKRFDFV